MDKRRVVASVIRARGEAAGSRWEAEVDVRTQPPCAYTPIAPPLGLGSFGLGFDSPLTLFLATPPLLK